MTNLLLLLLSIGIIYESLCLNSVTQVLTYSPRSTSEGISTRSSSTRSSDTLEQNTPADEFGVTHLNIPYNPEVDQCFCLIEAPTMEAVQKHDKFGIKCDWIMEVKTTN